uniref:EAL domain-containing protein n=1 Tax=Angiostrongylus cantonensis TaxID=6313 RepID=A0A0K0D3T3_ANGCA
MTGNIGYPVVNITQLAKRNQCNTFPLLAQDNELIKEIILLSHKLSYSIQLAMEVSFCVALSVAEQNSSLKRLL